MPKTTTAAKTTPPTLGTEVPERLEAVEQDAAYAGFSDDDLELVSLDDTDDFLNVLFWGREGSGKTTDALAMARIPHPGKIVVVNIEGGLKKIALAKRGIPTDRIVLWPRPGVRATFSGLEALHKKMLWDLQQDPTAYQGVVFDSVTEGSALLREDATNDRYRRLDNRNMDYDPTFIDRGDYGVQTDQMQRILRRFRDLPCHFVATALERYDEDQRMFGPAVNPALAGSLMGYVDLALYTKASQASPENDDDLIAEFRAATRPSNSWRAKDRFDVLPHVMANPTFDRVLSYVTGDLVESDDALQAEYAERQAARDAAESAAKAEKEAKKQAVRARRSATATRRQKVATGADEAVAT